MQAWARSRCVTCRAASPPCIRPGACNGASLMGTIASSLRLIQAGFTLMGPAQAFRRRSADAGARLGRALERLGPAYIKLGQMLATRPDIVGAEMATALEHLQDRLPPF